MKKNEVKVGSLRKIRKMTESIPEGMSVIVICLANRNVVAGFLDTDLVCDYSENHPYKDDDYMLEPFYVTHFSEPLPEGVIMARIGNAVRVEGLMAVRA